MKATELLKKQHRLVEDLFSKFKAADDAAKPAIFDELASNLAAHDAIERELFYPACERAFGKIEDILRESLVEHGLVEFCLFCSNKARRGDNFAPEVEVLSEIVEHHVEEEEEELLPKAEKALGPEASEALGSRMEQRFARALKSDYRTAVEDSLRQVLDGRVKTAPAKGPRPKAERPATKPSTRSHKRAHP